MSEPHFVMMMIVNQKMTETTAAVPRKELKVGFLKGKLEGCMLSKLDARARGQNI